MTIDPKEVIQTLAVNTYHLSPFEEGNLVLHSLEDFGPDSIKEVVVAYLYLAERPILLIMPENSVAFMQYYMCLFDFFDAHKKEVIDTSDIERRAELRRGGYDTAFKRVKEDDLDSFVNTLFSYLPEVQSLEGDKPQILRMAYRYYFKLILRHMMDTVKQVSEKI